MSYKKEWVIFRNRKTIFALLNIIILRINAINISTHILPIDALQESSLIDDHKSKEICCNEEPLSENTFEISLNRKKQKHNKVKKNKLKKKHNKKNINDIKNKRQKTTKAWTVMIYIAADNDLNFYAWKNIKQMEQVGSNSELNIVIQLSERGKHKVTQRYMVNQNHLVKSNFGNKKLNSGSMHTLINFCGWAIQSYPANNYALFLWNHGTGANEPSSIKMLNPSELFIFNPSTNMLELDRTIGFFDFMSIADKEEQELRGICIDESHNSYISNKQLDYALDNVCKNYLNGKKFNLIGFDACLMSMIEIANIVKKYSNIMVGSQEVELGAGWNYHNIFKLFAETSPDAPTLAKHIIHSYQQVYGQLTNDFTLSAMNLDYAAPLEENIHMVSQLLIESLDNQKGSSVKNVIKMCRSRRLCTSFDEPTYIDLHNFYTNMINNINYFQFKDETYAEVTRKKLKELLVAGISLIEKLVIANCVGKNLSQAKGLSIYFPEHKINPTYGSTPFAEENNWQHFIRKYLEY